MFFEVISRGTWVPDSGRNIAYLKEDNWDDYGDFRTMFQLTVFDRDGKKHEPGSLKIGEKDLLPSGQITITPPARAPSISMKFDALDDRFFSLGLDENYYEVINALDEEWRLRILVGLRDCAYDLGLFEKFKDEPVMNNSLTRSVSSATIRNKFHRLANGNAALTEFYFEYRFPNGAGSKPPPPLGFHVEPATEPPTNVHVLIGRNGVGKTRCLQSLVQLLLAANPNEAKWGSLDVRTESDLSGHGLVFPGLVVVSFSAFDNFEFPSGAEGRDRMRWEFIGLRAFHSTLENSDRIEIRRPTADDFCRSFEQCRSGPRRNRLKTALTTLSNDPLFAENAVSDLLELSDDEWRPKAEQLFTHLSSGHAAVLLTITRLVEFVDESTLVLMDEPEGHLHPPLLSAFIRALSDLLIARNGVAVISTHSPVVLQEVPKSCVWKLGRFGSVVTAERPAIETFGENVGILTREVFQLEVTTCGFHDLLRRAVDKQENDYESILAHFGSQLGAEARGILRSLLAVRSRTGPEGTMPPGVVGEGEEI